MDENQDYSKFRRLVKIIVVIFIVFIAAAIGYTTFFLNKINVAESTTKSSPEKDSKLNVLLIGVANGLSDTLMLCNYDPNLGKLNIVSIPRDTYYPRSGYKHAAQKKINSAYGSEGADGSVRSVEGLTGVNINYYVQIDYRAVEKIVDAIGGLPVTVPHDMDYDDPADNLHIHFKKGDVVEKGSDIIKLLRWRKNNHGGGYAEGDLGRVKTQHDIIKLGIDKLLNENSAINLVRVQEPIIEYIRTNMPTGVMLDYISKLSNIKSGSISIDTIPGAPSELEGLSFYVADEVKMAEMLKDMKDNTLKVGESK